MTKAHGTLYGVGVGPGDPELITLKAIKVLKTARIVGYFRKRGTPGHALTIARQFLAPRAVELPFEYPVTTELCFTENAYIQTISAFYAITAETISITLGMATMWRSFAREIRFSTAHSCICMNACETASKPSSFRA